MFIEIITILYIVVLAGFAGYEMIARVPSILHTPLMSATNFIHGIVLVGTIIGLGIAHDTLTRCIGFIGVLIATLNVVGGYLVTVRMLSKFQHSSNNKGK